jgi:alanyl-tRNA synthetase
LRASEIRTRFLEFFRERGHTVCPSDSLVPTSDPSLLFTGAGMNQFKDMFLGVGEPRFRRAATAQKCLRTGDLENVGRTAYHLTFFEMLGNFSFGDYFKEEAIGWAWEFLTEVMEFPAERLAVSVYRDDEEAFDVWRRKIGIEPGRVYRFGAKDNFWPSNAPEEGPNGPCGPCSEIFYDFGPAPGEDPGGDPSTSSRFAEIWNLVFTQFDRRDGGKLDPLPQKNIDTGMGFERLVAVHNGSRRVSETELFLPIIREVARRAGREYSPDAPDAFRMRRIADHARAVTFCLADGVLPSNEGRGYVERRLIRRAINDAHQIGIDGPFLHALVPVVDEIMGETYPEVRSRADRIARSVREEEERFGQTYERGLQILEGWAAELLDRKAPVLPGDKAFQLYDTYGFPVDLAAQILAERGLGVDRRGFEVHMEAQRERARGGTKMSTDIFGRGPVKALRETAGETCFLGYDALESEATIVGILAGGERVASAAEGTEVQVALDRTPFYAEAGGQIGDTGVLRGEAGVVRIEDTQAEGGLTLHRGTVTQGQLKEGDRIVATVDEPRRRAIMRNHTATHLLHRALREVVGEHAEQAGSMVAPERLRFDFTHASSVPKERLVEIETRVNRGILADQEVRTAIRPYREAIESGAVALFGEKYGDEVRTVEIAGVSTELCGGTHVSRTGEIGMFRITAEGSIAAGVRRIEAITGEAALDRSWEERDVIHGLCERLKVPEELLVKKVEGLAEEVRSLRGELEKARRGRLGSTARELASGAEEIGPHRLLVRRLEGLGPKELRDLADRIRSAWSSDGAEGVLVLASGLGDGVHLIAAATKGLTGRGIHAGRIIGDLARSLGGGGGGRPDLAQGQGKSAESLEAALETARDRVRADLAAPPSR